MEPKVESIIHAENLTAEERAKFNKPVISIEQIIEILKNGTNGKTVLLLKRDNPDENVEIEYRKVVK